MFSMVLVGSGSGFRIQPFFDTDPDPGKWYGFHGSGFATLVATKFFWFEAERGPFVGCCPMKNWSDVENADDKLFYPPIIPVMLSTLETSFADIWSLSEFRVHLPVQSAPGRWLWSTPWWCWMRCSLRPTPRSTRLEQVCSSTCRVIARVDQFSDFARHIVSATYTSWSGSDFFSHHRSAELKKCWHFL